MVRNARIRFHSLKILTGFDLSRRRLPMMWVESRSRGPVVWITACGHGDEVTGIVIIQELFALIRKYGLQSGSIYAFPIMNPIGFEHISRYIPYSDEDLNRSFPGDPDGSLAERMADKIFSTILDKQPDLLIDLHNDWIQSIPYVLIDPVHEKGEVFSRALSYARKSGFATVLDTDVLRRSLSFNLLNKGVPAITLELGEAYVVNETNVQYGLQAIMGMLNHAGVMSSPLPKQVYDLPEHLKEDLLYYSDKPLCSKSGILRFFVKPGIQVKKGQVVAKIYNAYGRLQETIYAPASALVLGHRETSLAYPGASVISFGLLEGKG